MEPLSNIKELVAKIANRRGIGRESQAAFICHKYRQIAPTIFTEEVLNYSYPKSFKDNILTIAVANSAWSQEIHMNKIVLLQSLNNEIKPHTIKQIQVLISKAENILT